MMSIKPQTDSFLFRGHDMKEEFGIWMTKSDPLIPSQRQQFLDVPFQDGAYEFEGEYYDMRKISVECDTRNAMSRHQLRYLVKLLTLKSPIVFWDEPEVYYLGKIYDDKGFRDMCRFIREFTLSFICDPFAYGERVQMSLPPKYAYKATARTPTQLAITNTGTSNITNVQIRIRTRNQQQDPIDFYNSI